MLDLAGYVQVDEFGDDEEYEEEEVVYVTLDLGAVQPTLLSSSASYKLIGLETETPFLQLSGTIFKGQHNSLLGTELLFSEDERNKKSLNFLTNTRARICFKEVQLVPKGTETKSKGRRSQANGSDDAVVIGNETPSIAMDRMTGKNPPPTRDRRSNRQAKSADPDQPTPKKRKRHQG